MAKKKKISTPPGAKPQGPSETQSPKCFVCDKECATDQELESHIGSQHGPRFNCQCAHCTGKRRHDSAKLVEESTRRDGDKDVKLFKCIVCNYQVFLLCKCLSHIQMVHNTVPLTNQYECMKCNLGFALCTELNDHIQTHAGAQKIARCGFQHCKKCFTTATMLKTHLRNNHKVTKPYEYLNNVKGSLVNPKAPNMVLNNASNQQVSRVSPSSSSNNTSAVPTSSFTSAWLSPDPPSPPPTGNTESEPPQRKAETKTAEKREQPLNPHLTCKICNKEHKSQTSYNNHMVVFHKQKFSAKMASASKKKRRRRNNDEESDLSSDWTSEDSDWEPSNTRKRSYATRKSSRIRPASDSSNAEEANRDDPASSSNPAPATHNTTGDPRAKQNTAPTSASSETPKAVSSISAPSKAVNQVATTTDTADKTSQPPHIATSSNKPSSDHPPKITNIAPSSHDVSHQENGGHHDCLACQQEKQPAPVVRIKQEPGVEPTREMAMPIISNVFSMTTAPVGNNNQGSTIPGGVSVPQTSHGYRNQFVSYQPPPALIKTSPPSTSYNVVPSPQFTQFDGGDDSTASAGSSLHNGSGNHGSAVTPPTNTSPAAGWLPPSAAIPHVEPADCATCLARKSNQNMCVHCGIIFLEPTMHMIHMGWHGKEHPFQCHTCGHICKDKYNFTTHIFKAPHL